ncbi:hypothetical protein [Chamaesiphon sp. OTE_20_metabat_361]|uniref:hypothetical protein n=1 Tax=Chamaesiphon sp. OTE_20_metabat_361 TaxID=2964689 RepID=UPI00286C606A|nr:hypothetical protein [Chamaesiphon sp. OTE_20_metabat_361]
MSLKYPRSVDLIGGAILILRVFSPAIDNYIDSAIVTCSYLLIASLTALVFTRSIAPKVALERA